jgi:hypothetical protein
MAMNFSEPQKYRYRVYNHRGVGFGNVKMEEKNHAKIN